MCVDLLLGIDQISTLANIFIKELGLDMYPLFISDNVSKLSS